MTLLRLETVRRRCTASIFANDMISLICKFGVFASIKTILGFEGMDFGPCRKPFASISEEGKEALRRGYSAYCKQL